MRSQYDSHRHRRRRARDLPSARRKAAQVDHTNNTNDAEDVHPLEALENLWHFFEEITSFGFFGRCTPIRHISKVL